MIKQAIVIRKDLKMRRGKEIAQGAHASMAWLSNRLRGTGRDRSVNLSDAEVEWLDGLFTKVCLQVDSEAELRAVHEAALAAGLVSEIITDAGKTEFGGTPTVTCCAIGPDEAERVDAVTGSLRLY